VGSGTVGYEVGSETVGYKVGSATVVAVGEWDEG